MSVSATITSKLTVVEQLATNIPFVDPHTGAIIHNGMDETVLLNATTTPPAAQVAAFQQALTSGAATIDLTSMVGTDGETVNGTGQKVQACKFRNPSTNANAIRIKIGASNGYALGTTFDITLAPGASFGPFNLGGTAPVIGSSAKTLDLSGTGAQALDVLIVLG
jgi:hypothetical protein